LGPLSSTFHPGFDRQLGFQRGEGAACLVFFPESNPALARSRRRMMAKSGQ